MDLKTDLEALLKQEPLDDSALSRLREEVFSSRNAYEAFCTVIKERLERGPTDDPAEALRNGAALLLLGRAEQAVEWLEKAPDGPMKYLLLGRARRMLGDFEAAESAFDRAQSAGAQPVAVALEKARTALAAGDLDKAEALVESVAESGHESADRYYLRGRIFEARGLKQQAVESYERALDFDPDHREALFRLAYMTDLAGDDDTAIDLYEALASMTPVHVNALLNLAVLYEDHGRYEAAERCLRKVLEFWPNHERAKMFLKDVLSSKSMIIDEGLEQRKARRSALLNIPLSDFELSVRARNCLRSMGINTIGDLLKVTEEQLLAHKNFGETSLREVKQLLASKGLRLGQALEEQRSSGEHDLLGQVQGDPAVLNKPVSELQLSVRARRALERLNIQTLGELASRTEAELLSVKNFGQTSLNEIKQRLAEYGLSLRKV